MTLASKPNDRKPVPRKARALTNAAAKTAAKSQAIASAEAVRQYRRQRWNPLRTLSPETLTRALESFEYGDLREFAVLAETMAERDDTLKSVKPKREKATAHRDWNILKRKKSAAADRHQGILEDFWKNVRAENAYDRNERGGIRLLIKQMMSAVSYRYAPHHIVWQPEPGKLRATFEFVPLWFFENRTGKLRFIRDGVGIEGEEMDEREWMVTVGDGLMVACAILFLAKRYCMQDLLAFSEKFSMPGIVGATSAAKGSPEGLAMKAAVEAFGQDWTAVMYGVADPTKPPIHLIAPNGNPSAMPMPAVIERACRSMAALYRGNDLGSMSSKEGEGTGASLQAEETEILEADDCEMISETLRGIERQVIEWHDGKGTEPLAYIEIQPPVREDKQFLVTAMTFLSDKGVRLAKKDALERLGFSEADGDEPALGEATVPEKVPAANSKEWKAFAPETGTLAIPRSIMPQIAAGNRAAMVNLLKAHGIDYVKADMKPADLKPTQAEYSTEKLARAMAYEGTPRAILVSSDNHVVDGHHQYLAALKSAPNSPIPVFKIKAPIMHVLGLVLQMRSTAQERTPAANAGVFTSEDGTFRDWVDQVRGKEDPAAAVAQLRSALAKDLQPLGAALEGALQAGDEAAFKAALKKISASLPELAMGHDLADALAPMMADAFTRGLSDQP